MQSEHINGDLDANKPLLLPILPSWWRVLPAVVLIVIITTIDSLTLNDLIEYRYANQYHKNSWCAARAASRTGAWAAPG